MTTPTDARPLGAQPPAPVLHGSYRARPGAGIEVLTTSHLPSPLWLPKSMSHGPTVRTGGALSGP
ncbi:MAG: hypothetical protein WBY94_24915 [Polyangiaceae bacterium]